MSFLDVKRRAEIHKLFAVAAVGECSLSLVVGLLSGFLSVSYTHLDQSTESDLIIFTTTIPSDYKVPTLMQDRQYRVAVAWQNVAYNQPPHLSYNLEESFNTAGAIKISSGSLSQVVDLGAEMIPVEFSIVRATGVTSTGLPEGRCV